MKIASRENFRFTDKRLGMGSLVTVPWLLIVSLGIADPHRGGMGIPMLLAGLTGIACVVGSVRKTRECLFVFLTFIVSMMTVMMPLVCTAY